jgi:serine phosphatase RsbU (regulator of sigma subunit)/pSer/pThr/pTyr-binding forkhead associated (FHA) protein
MTIPTELIVRDAEDKTVTVPLNRDRFTVGRSSACELAYPDDSGLSRQHVALTRNGDKWQVQDLGSKNGTLLNGKRLDGTAPFGMGDRISAGHLTIEFAGSDATAAIARNKVVFVEGEGAARSTTTVAASLDSLIGASGIDDMNKTSIIQTNPQMQALIRAGRELVGYRPLNELFEVIMDLAMEAVMAARGVLMTLENGELIVRAARGAGFKISTTVRDRVLKDKTSLLVRDTQLDQALREQMSIVQNKVRSMIAVPLQTNDRVIGLIYVDTPDLIREFTREDLGLLTVMANVAAIRIEHARLSEIEAVERAMAKELEQAAHIQMGLLPSKSPEVRGMDIAGGTLPCRTVGGDYYDYLPFPDGRIGVLIGDVAGKGMPASLLMSSLQARVKVLFEDGDDLAQKINRLNKHTAASCPDNRFITFFMTIVDPATGELVYTNAGHNPPLLVRKNGTVEQLQGGGIILGILGIAKYQDFRIRMDPGDTLVLYSDGVTEAVNPSDVDFGEDRLGELTAALRGRPASEVVAKIQSEVAKFAAGAPQADDITVVVMRRL